MMNIILNAWVEIVSVIRPANDSNLLMSDRQKTAFVCVIDGVKKRWAVQTATMLFFYVAVVSSCTHLS